MLFLLLACVPPASVNDDSAPDPCPMLDCRDTLSLTVLGVDGGPSLWFSYNVDAGGTTLSGICGASPDTQPDAICYGDGRVDLHVYSESLDVLVAEGDDAPYWSGTLTPSWTAPYDSEECGHYCYIADETIQLLPCEGCG